MLLVKNIKVGKIKIFKFYIIFLLSLLMSFKIYSAENLEGTYTNIKILDKISSKTNKLNLKINEEKQYENLFIKILMCKNSEFDDNPEVTAYLQVTDITMKDNDKVFIFNGWTFSSSPSIRPFDHPVYDIWLLKCF